MPKNLNVDLPAIFFEELKRKVNEFSHRHIAFQSIVTIQAEEI